MSSKTNDTIIQVLYERVASVIESGVKADITPAEWRIAFEQFRTFKYATRARRLDDLESVTILGLGCLADNNLWAESIQLINWALADPQFSDESKHTVLVYYYKALATIHLEGPAEGLKCFIDQLSVTPPGWSRQLLFAAGVRLTFELRELLGAKAIDIVPNIVVEFVRQIIIVGSPGIKIPRSIVAQSEPSVFTWSKLRRVMSQICYNK